jgi:hypothetical protein
MRPFQNRERLPAGDEKKQIRDQPSENNPCSPSCFAQKRWRDLLRLRAQTKLESAKRPSDLIL